MTPPDFSNPLIDASPPYKMHMNFQPIDLMLKDRLLTKRERFAMAAMQGLMSMCKNPKVTTRELAEDSVAIADALTSALKSIPEPQ